MKEVVVEGYTELLSVKGALEEDRGCGGSWGLQSKSEVGSGCMSVNRGRRDADVSGEVHR